MAKFDGVELVLTERYKAALHELMRAELEMMQQFEPEFAEEWVWGSCEVGDLVHNNSLIFIYGGEEDRPPKCIGVDTLIEEEI